MIEIELLGELEQFGPIPPLNVRSPAEAIKFISDQVPAFREFLASTQANAYQVIVDGCDILEEHLNFPALKKIIIQPVIAGASNFGKIILGVALLGLSLLVPAGILGISAATIGSFGVSLVIGGLIGALQQPAQEQKNEASYQLDANGQPRSSQGQSVPVLVGERIIQGLVISISISNENIAVGYVPA
jgi:predicted phage tail protein